MRDQREEWLELCERAAVEQDHEKLLVLIRRINELLEAKDKASSAKPHWGKETVPSIAK
jgi:hypothetical protein